MKSEKFVASYNAEYNLSAFIPSKLASIAETARENFGQNGWKA